MTGPRWELTTPPAVTIGRSDTLWLSMPLTSTTRVDFATTRTSAPARPPLAPLSTNEPFFDALWFAMSYTTLS